MCRITNLKQSVSNYVPTISRWRKSPKSFSGGRPRQFRPFIVWKRVCGVQPLSLAELSQDSRGRRKAPPGICRVTSSREEQRYSTVVSLATPTGKDRPFLTCGTAVITNGGPSWPRFPLPLSRLSGIGAPLLGRETEEDHQMLPKSSTVPRPTLGP